MKMYQDNVKKDKIFNETNNWVSKVKIDNPLSEDLQQDKKKILKICAKEINEFSNYDPETYDPESDGFIYTFSESFKNIFVSNVDNGNDKLKENVLNILKDSFNDIDYNDKEDSFYYKKDPIELEVIIKKYFKLKSEEGELDGFVVSDFLNKLKNVLFSENYVIKKNVSDNSKIGIIGDLHGNVHALCNNLNRLKKEKFFKQDSDFELSENHYLIFLGDYTDRGFQGIEVLQTLLLLKNKNWDNVILLRGNHEDLGQNNAAHFGLISVELMHKYNTFDKNKFIVSLDEFYNTLPSALFLSNSKAQEYIQFSHGGIGAYQQDNQYYTFKNLLDLKGNTTFECINDFHYGFSWLDFEKKNQFIHCTDEIRVKNGLKASNLPTENAFFHNILWSQYKNLNLQLKAIFRGHQHSDFGLKLFEKNQKEGDPMNWRDVCNISDKEKNIEGENVKIEGENVKKDDFSVYTLSSVGEVLPKSPYSSFMVLEVNDSSFEDWIKKIWEYK
jgi:hypothetical protein